MASAPSRLCLAIGCLAAGLGSTAGAPQTTSPPALTLEPCTVPGLEEQVRCGVYPVWENRATRQGRTISLRVVVLPATGDDPAADPIVFFAGGPGGSTVELAPGLAVRLADARRRRDLLLVDARGTGGSGALFCPYQQEPRGVDQVLGAFLPLDRLAACREALSAHASLRLYTTDAIVDDVAEVAAALGYRRVNLMGASYGSRAALVYLRRHPESVRTVTVEGVVPTDAAMPSAFARDAQDALDKLFRACADDAACHAAYPDPAADLEALLERLGDRPATVAITVPGSRGQRTVTLSRPALVRTLRYMQYQALPSLRIPAYLRAAADGDFEPLAVVAHGVAGNLSRGIADGLYLSVTCAEDVPLIDLGQASADAAGSYLGDQRLHQQRRACTQWPRGTPPASFHLPVRSATPVFLISGERDPVTPPRWAEAAARHLANSRQLVIPDGAHGSAGLHGVECVDRLIAAFVEQGGFAGLDLDACRRSIVRPPFLLPAAAPGAVELTVDELSRFVGSFEGADAESRIAVELVDGRLRLLSRGDDVALIPLGATRFTWDGAAQGTYLDFVDADGAVTTVDYVYRGKAMMTLKRVDLP